MAIDGLNIIGESINDSVPQTHALFDAHDMNGIRKCAVFQDTHGAHFIDVNVGIRTASFMAEIVSEIQKATTKPLSIDSPDKKIAAAGLQMYDADKAGGRLPVMNSISPLRKEMFDFYKIKKFMPILMVSERLEKADAGGTNAVPNNTAGETYETAKEMLSLARTHGIPAHQCFIDVGIAPLAIDTGGMTRRTVESIKLIADDPDFSGCSFVLGISNFTHMLPSKRSSDNLSIRSGLESALLTLLFPLGLTTIIGSVKRNFQLLPPDHPASRCLADVLRCEGFDTVLRVQQFLSE